ncbi:FAD-binding oxidoreductase [Kineococcus aurantiacus]|uniref:Glycolate oxidase n=1 Tax=Kineococcus aurantiacus TaxID=37633 RepID=A0A7Y9DHR3_9ACTN|nr:FAD-linked oxidase C-terminal domain-containing protein [Kineococcus aurantiacus]NYD21641.1 glycolate oxidase [Kineococcus aurantiacus]
MTTELLPDVLTGPLAELDAALPGAVDVRFAAHEVTDRSRVDAPAGVLAVVRPADVEGVQAVLRWATRHRVPVVPRGAGTGLSGGAVGVAGGIVLSTERLDRILEIAPADQVARVEPGVLGADLDAALAPLGLRYAPDPASWRVSSIGGNVATNAGGLRCAKYGVTRESVLALDVVLADGTLVSTGHRSIKGVTGLDLVGLFTGSEGTLGVVVGITVRLRPRPVREETVAAWFDSVDAAAQGLLAITAGTARPAVVELLDGPTLGDVDAHSGTSLAAHGDALLLVQTDGHGAEAEAAEVEAALAGAGGRTRRLHGDDAEFHWELRRTGRGPLEDELAVGEDVAVPLSRIGQFHREITRIGAAHGVSVRAVAHAGDGNFHPLLFADEVPGAAERLEAAADEVVATALRLGGTISGEHGIGTAKQRWLADELAPRVRELQAGIKAVFDPLGLLNPGKAL